MIAGIIDFRRNNVFGRTAFTSYGLFWLGLSLPTVLEATGIYPKVSPGEFATWMILWSVFTLYMAGEPMPSRLGPPQLY